MTELIVFFFLFWTAEALINLPKSYEARFESATSVGSTYYYRFRLLGREHRVNGTIFFEEDLGNDISITAQTYNDPTGSGDFKQTPFGLPTTPICKFIESYWKYFEPSMVYGKNTNAPFGNHTCPIPKGEYYVKDVTVKPDSWPLIMPRGFFKGIANISRDNQVVVILEVVVSIKDRTNF